MLLCQIIRLKKCVPHLNNAIKLGQYNVGREWEILTVPLYMGFFIKDTLTEVIVPDIDMSLLGLNTEDELGYIQLS